MMNNSDFHRTGKYIVDYLLPLTLVIGSGIGTYLFTGGEEEFPPVEEEVFSREGEESLIIEDNDKDQAIKDETVSKANEMPDWVNEVQQRLETIQKDLTDIKTKLLRPISPLAGTKIRELPHEIAEVKNEMIIASLPLPEYQRQIHNAIYRFAFQLPDDLSCNIYEVLDHTDFLQVEMKKSDPSVVPKEYQEGIELLLLFIKNVIKNPTIPRYQRISINNTNFKSILKPLVGYHSILTAIGFELKGIYYEFEWKITANDSKSIAIQEKRQESLPIPTVEDALILLHQMLDLLNSLKESKVKVLQLVQQQRSILINNDHHPGNNIGTLMDRPTKVTASPIIISDNQVSSQHSTTSPSSTTHIPTVSPLKHNVNLYPISPTCLPTSYHPPKFDEIIQKISKSDQSKPPIKIENKENDTLEEI